MVLGYVRVCEIHCAHARVRVCVSNNVFVCVNAFVCVCVCVCVCEMHCVCVL